LAKTDARDGPTRSIAVNQSTFVNTSGPITAKANPTHASAPTSKLWSPSCGAASSSSGTETMLRKTALRRTASSGA
jgi:hypothetical protein